MYYHLFGTVVHRMYQFNEEHDSMNSAHETWPSFEFAAAAKLDGSTISMDSWHQLLYPAEQMNEQCGPIKVERCDRFESEHVKSWRTGKRLG